MEWHHDTRRLLRDVLVCAGFAGDVGYQTSGGCMSEINVRLHQSFAGAKFRPVTWHALTENGADLKGYGVEVKGQKDRRYKIAAVHGDTIPFGNKKEADAWCKAANIKAIDMLKAREAT